MRWQRAFLLCVALQVLALPASAGEAACDAWFPDFQCDRSGRFDGFEKPIVQPYLFEDPFVTTNAVPYFLWHDFPDQSIFDGGSLYAAAVQLRVALTDRVAIIATKDGFVWNRNNQDILSDSQGFMNLAAGVKVALWQDREAGRIVSGILRIEAPTGSSDQYQGHGSGMAVPSLAAAFRTGPVRWIGDVGAQIPFNTHEQSTSIFYHLYAGLDLTPHAQPFVQLSGISWIDAGNGSLPINTTNAGLGTVSLSTAQAALGTGSFEGADVANLGSRGVNGLDLLTAALGVHIPLTEHLTFTVAYERPFTEPKGIFKQRITTAMVLEF
jgi:hypothetical protein